MRPNVDGAASAAARAKTHAEVAHAFCEVKATTHRASFYADRREEVAKKLTAAGGAR